MAKLRCCELTGYDTKGLEGIQSSDYLMGAWKNRFCLIIYFHLTAVAHLANFNRISGAGSVARASKLF